MMRCSWAQGDERMEQYHDELWGVPVYDDQELFAKLCLDCMQAGLSWRTILYKKEAFYEAFEQFEIEKVAAFGEDKIDEMLQNSGIIRHRKKIEALIQNAGRVLEIQKEFGSFSKYLWGFSDGKIIDNPWGQDEKIPATSELSDCMSKDMKKRGFKFVGSTTLYAFLQAVGIINDHVADCHCRTESM
ncbi:MAG: DNA-3-methyladenine glycosylase I [Turicibacter sp.]|nr:DNA-3-methyladenine glycosylase I [Turicibacter sp.]